MWLFLYLIKHFKNNKNHFYLNFIVRRKKIFFTKSSRWNNVNENDSNIYLFDDE